MGLGIFRRAFVVRRFGEENIVDGYGVSEYKDFIASLNVQPLSKDELQALPEGENTVKRMKAFGDLVFHTADRSAGRRADWLFYQGRMDPEGHWYECVSSLGVGPHDGGSLPQRVCSGFSRRGQSYAAP